MLAKDVKEGMKVRIISFKNDDILAHNFHLGDIVTVYEKPEDHDDFPIVERSTSNNNRWFVWAKNVEPVEEAELIGELG
jgi:hypothetical protein